jgi:Thiolase, C-terminal domain
MLGDPPSDSAKYSARLGPQCDTQFIRWHGMPLPATDFNSCVGTAAEMGQPQPGVVAEMTTAPLEHRPHHRHEVGACLGEHIFVAHPLPRLAVGPAGEQPGVDEFGQSRRSRRLGDANPAGEVVEPRETGANLAKTNVNGGAIAIGHPLGASGARIMTTLVNALEQRGGQYGLQTMCEGGGMANATIVERL